MRPVAGSLPGQVGPEANRLASTGAPPSPAGVQRPPLAGRRPAAGVGLTAPGWGQSLASMAGDRGLAWSKVWELCDWQLWFQEYEPTFTVSRNLSVGSATLPHPAHAPLGVSVNSVPSLVAHCLMLSLILVQALDRYCFHKQETGAERVSRESLPDLDMK